MLSMRAVKGILVLEPGTSRAIRETWLLELRVHSNATLLRVLIYRVVWATRRISQLSKLSRYRETRIISRARRRIYRGTGSRSLSQRPSPYVSTSPHPRPISSSVHDSQGFISLTAIQLTRNGSVGLGTLLASNTHCLSLSSQSLFPLQANE